MTGDTNGKWEAVATNYCQEMAKFNFLAREAIYYRVFAGFTEPSRDRVRSNEALEDKPQKFG